ncbi:hypothetical protein F503_00967 [Ophiostoma piceae UAMH 11346]|uniref:Uncharacterized protein n=1 Tax=Ophiostoma piceae (strain UAMH 11346) TaxID=1262450 RepID=S3C3V1_OPHP1|nr:hypothetical protein F503_00967 [Ophiostoma piceae UAMH 11346]
MASTYLSDDCSSCPYCYGKAYVEAPCVHSRVPVRALDAAAAVSTPAPPWATVRPLTIFGIVSIVIIIHSIVSNLLIVLTRPTFEEKNQIIASQRFWKRELWRWKRWQPEEIKARP